MHRGFYSQSAPWPIIQIYLPGRTYIHIQGLLKGYLGSITFQESDYEVIEADQYIESMIFHH